MRVLVRSRIGNLVLAAAGAVYALSSVGVLAWLAIDVWQSAAFIDYLLSLALLGSAVCGLWFVGIARENLGDRQRVVDASNAASIQR